MQLYPAEKIGLPPKKGYPWWGKRVFKFSYKKKILQKHGPMVNKAESQWFNSPTVFSFLFFFFPPSFLSSSPPPFFFPSFSPPLFLPRFLIPPQKFSESGTLGWEKKEFKFSIQKKKKKKKKKAYKNYDPKVKALVNLVGKFMEFKSRFMLFFFSPSILPFPPTYSLPLFPFHILFFPPLFLSASPPPPPFFFPFSPYSLSHWDLQLSPPW